MFSSRLCEVYFLTGGSVSIDEPRDDVGNGGSDEESRTQWRSPGGVRNFREFTFYMRCCDDIMCVFLPYFSERYVPSYCTWDSVERG